MPTRSFLRRSDAEIARAWHFATRDASSVMLTREDVNWIDGVIAEVRRRKLAPWAGDAGSSAPATPVKVPPYTVEFHQRMIAPPGVLVEVVVPSLSRSTPRAKIEQIGFAILRREGGDRLNLFSTRIAYLANDDAEYARAHPGALEKGYIGRIEGGVFQPSTY